MFIYKWLWLTDHDSKKEASFLEIGTHLSCGNQPWRSQHQSYRSCTSPEGIASKWPAASTLVGRCNISTSEDPRLRSPDNHPHSHISIWNINIYTFINMCCFVVLLNQEEQKSDTLSYLLDKITSWGLSILVVRLIKLCRCIWCLQFSPRIRSISSPKEIWVRDCLRSKMRTVLSTIRARPPWTEKSFVSVSNYKIWHQITSKTVTARRSSFNHMLTSKTLCKLLCTFNLHDKWYTNRLNDVNTVDW